MPDEAERRAEPLTMAGTPIIGPGGVTAARSARAGGRATGAIIRMTTTLSTPIEIAPGGGVHRRTRA